MGSRLDSVPIYIGARDMAYCMRLAQDAAALGARIEARGKEETYRANDAGHQLTAKLGEFAVWAWAKANGMRVSADFTTRNRCADITLFQDGKPFGVEVKTYRSSSWHRYGPEVSKAQMSRVKSRSAVVVWVVSRESGVASPIDTMVSIVGFTRTAEMDPATMKTRDTANGGHTNYLVQPIMVEPMARFFELYDGGFDACIVGLES